MKRFPRKVLCLAVGVCLAVSMAGIVYADFAYRVTDHICEDPPGGLCTVPVDCGPGILQGIDPANIRVCEDCVDKVCDVFTDQLCFSYYDCADPEIKWEYLEDGCLS